VGGPPSTYATFRPQARLILIAALNAGWSAGPACEPGWARQYRREPSRWLTLTVPIVAGTVPVLALVVISSR
jgi:hypothetical protein